ncbi:putative cytochrome P450 [Aspergillus sclerotioniger CBS 115572]|uniref:Putative cytochrome P450 n=1 Tax=Aspergillus sclerotioniger CBS 115572 TaxID=1450535 RepID=A0A317XET4_9EURO|nr:putative cytochrome P450 [Aspergillus sclerotioniger CBS 115572]PWY96731.1 putative cytochrome P450 [Aspergillus sclerotioniger CBS 115572]
MRPTFLTTTTTGNAAVTAPFVGSRHAWLARWEFFQSAQLVLQKGYSQYKDQPWKLTGNDVVVLPHKYLDEIRKLPVQRANAMKANLDNMQSKFTHLEILNSTRLFVHVLKRKLNPQLAILIPTVRRELDAAFTKEIPQSISEDEWTSVEAFHTLHKIVGRISARIFGGRELRDDEHWLNAAEGYLNNIFATAISIRLVPYGFKTLASWFLPCSWEISWNFWKAKRILLPYIRYRKRIIAQRADEISRMGKSEFPDVLQYLIEQAEGRDAEPLSLAAMVLSLSLASNHTTAMALTECLYDLCAHPEYQDELRQEVQDAIEADGGWRKTTLLRMRRLDSFMKESQRMHPPSLMGYKRKIIEATQLSDGLHLPAGAHVEFAIVPIQHDSVADPTRFDGLRYYRMRQTPAEAHRHQFATTSNSVLHFGHGQNSCPGRFMASNVIKMVLGTLLTEYDFKLDQTVRPDGISAFEYNFPNPTARVLLRKKKKKAPSPDGPTDL